MKYVYPAIVQPEDNGLYSIWFPDLPGCATQGTTLIDAVDAAADALGGWLYVNQKRGDALPIPSETKMLPADGKQFTTLVMTDLDAYRRMVDNKAVKKTLTIPSWLNDQAEAAHVNYSGILQEALINRLGL